jgi:uncharacterized phage-associated protein
MYNVFAIANWFLRKSPVDHKKLQKLCYYTQAWSYALKNRPIINDTFEAWVHGPVCRTLYNKYAGRSFEDLKLEPSAADIAFTPDECELLESVWLTYGGSTGNALEALSHTEPPWIIARGGLAPHEPCTTPIDPEDMKRYYRSIYAGDPENEA